MTITKVNSYCTAICQSFNKPLPEINEYGFCTYCKSINASKLEEYLDSGTDAEWRQPNTGTWVDSVLVKKCILFNLNHLFDEPLTQQDYNRIVGKIEDKAGNLALYMKRLSKCAGYNEDE